jgi:hypothetical protein
MLKQSSGLLLAIALSCAGFTVAAQNDSLVLSNGNFIAGEIKSMDKGVLIIETDYSKNDFSIEWTGIKEIYSTNRFLVTLMDGRRINGSLKSDGAGKVVLESIEGEKIETTLSELVYMKGLESEFWSRAHTSIDLGFSFTKANNLRQFSMRSTAGYLADRWALDMYYNGIRSAQDSVEATKRTEAGISYKYYLQHDWFLMAAVNFLSNTEQALQLRTTTKLGAGKYMVHTNKSYWALGGGISYNNESFTNDTPHRNSAEGFFGTELNMFDVGDLNLLTTFYVYPSFTEAGRWRSDFKFDTKYDFPHDFYVKLGFTMNYDNRPAVQGNETDYVFQITFGWEL